MISTTHTAYGITASVYIMDKGDKIARHKHEFEHSHFVVSGRTQVELGTGKRNTFECLPNQAAVYLPSGFEHEISALEDGTVIINIAQGSWGNGGGKGGAGGGVILHDGTVAYEKT